MRALSDSFDAIPVRGMEDGEADNWGYKTCGKRDKLSLPQLAWPSKVDLRVKPS